MAHYYQNHSTHNPILPPSNGALLSEPHSHTKVDTGISTRAITFFPLLFTTKMLADMKGIVEDDDVHDASKLNAPSIIRASDLYSYIFSPLSHVPS